MSVLPSSPPVAASPVVRETLRRLVAEYRHDLRTPINAILGYTELLQEDWADRGHAVDELEVLADLRQVGRNWLRAINETLSDDHLSVSLSGGLGELANELLNKLSPSPEAAADMLGQLMATAVLDRLADAEDLGRIGTAIGDFWERLMRPPSPPLESPQSPDLPESLTGVVRDALRSGDPLLPPSLLQVKASRLLVVDDQEPNRDLLGRRLRKLGHVVTTAGSGPDALAILAERPESFDLVLLDVMMPGMSGVEVLRVLKADSRWQKIPVVMISALDEIASVATCIEQGAEDYLPKPCDPVLLEARVNACLEQKQLRDAEIRHREQIDRERKRHEDLLHVLLPARIVDELKQTGTVRPRRYENVAVLFADLVGFTAFCDVHPPETVLSNLQALVAEYETISCQYGLQKIKTIGDCYMAVAGLLEPVDNAVRACVRCGLAMVEAAGRHPAGWQVRVGVHVGPVVAGILGHRQYLFDVWGDTVNMAARTEHHGRAGHVSLSTAAWDWLRCEADADPLPAVELKGKGLQTLYLFRQFHDESLRKKPCE